MIGVQNGRMEEEEVKAMREKRKEEKVTGRQRLIIDNRLCTVILNFVKVCG